MDHCLRVGDALEDRLAFCGANFANHTFHAAFALLLS